MAYADGSGYSLSRPQVEASLAAAEARREVEGFTSLAALQHRR